MGMQGIYKYVFFFWGLALFPILSSAQSETGQFRFEHITVNEGLSHSDAMCVTQDPLGFIWIGTNKGLDRYDGHELKKYELPLNDQTGTAVNRIRTLHIDQKGHLWTGVERAGLYWYNADYDRFFSIRERPGAQSHPLLVQQLARVNINAMASDASNRMWIATHQLGLFCIQFTPTGAIQYIRKIDLPGLSEPTITRLSLDQRGQLWIGTMDHGLWVLNRPGTSTMATQVKVLKDTNIRALHLDRRGDLWIGSGGQVFWVDSKSLSNGINIQPEALKRSFAEIESLYLDSAHRLWIGTSYGLLLVNAGTLAGVPVDEKQVHIFLPHDNDPHSINSVRVHNMMEDRFHNVWLATSAGGLNLLKLQSKAFGLLRRQMLGSTTPAHNYINAVYKDEKAQRLWMGTRNGFASYDLKTKTYRDYLNRPTFGQDNGVDVSAFYQDRKGTLWIGTRYRGLMRLTGTGDLFSLPAMPLSSGWNSVSIENITQDRHGIIWIATFNAGILAYAEDGTFLQAFSSQNKTMPTRQFTSLLYDPSQDVLWASTRDRGVLKLKITGSKLQVLKEFGHQPENIHSLKTNYAWPLVKDRQGNIWVGTIGGGLHRISVKNETIERYDRRVPEKDVESMLMDESGNLWIGGAGLYEFNPQKNQLLHYDVTDGLQSNSFKVGAAFRSNDGTLYMGGINGITYFKPADIRPNPYPPLVQITDLRIHNQSVTAGDTLNGRVLISQSFADSPKMELDASENDFSLTFVGLNYANPKKQRYAYQLEGYTKDWVELPAGQRTASFSNLPAGDYIFRVRATNGDDVWSTNSLSLPITVLPPWWKSWWAYVIYALVISGALFVYRGIATAQQDLKNKLAFEKFQNEKEKELTDLKLRFFTNVSHELRTPLTLILGPIEELLSSRNQWPGLKEKVVLMHGQTRKLLDLVNQLLDFRKVESGHLSLKASKENITSFVTELFLIFKLKAEEKELDYELISPQEAIPLYFDRDKLEIILTNLLSNAFKYTPSKGKVRFYLEVVGDYHQNGVFTKGHLTNHYLEIRVRDWGTGMQEAELEHIFDPYYQASHTETLRVMGSGIGLSLVKQWVERHQGEISVVSSPGNGTTFTVRLPFGPAHLQEGDLRTAEPVIDTSITPENLETLAEPLLPPSRLPNSLRLLIVEDNEELRTYLQQLFVDDFEVITAKDGLEGWTQALTYLPDLIVSDIMMPGSDGLELCRKVKQHPKTAHIPVVLLTARAAALYELEGLETGADDYVSKPFHPKVLVAKVTGLLQNRMKLREYYHRQILLEPGEVVIPDADKQFLEKAMQIVESQLQEPDFNVQILVQEMGMSQSVFYRRLKSITGQTVVEFIRDIRMKRAAQLLASTNIRVSDVAYQVGIEDVKYFRKMFQKLYNVPPSEYARQFRTTEVVDDLSEL
ncbi:hybrid sensor histidine kinase/response regulator [Siphonobacter sp. SORGH_AS_0500]|nr:hybrid sensor histidine kinase/response regulator [Siphonobacter sp. SORGH_AS_0500]